MRIIKYVREAFLLPLRFYRRFISPHTAPKCKYYPTCSEYAMTAVRRHGILYGGALAVWRLLRCNPWSKGGIDYVPERTIFQRLKKDRKEE